MWGRPADVIGRCQDRDSSKRVQGEQISVARHEYVWASVDGYFEKRVVSGIPRSLNDLHNRHDLDEGREPQ